MNGSSVAVCYTFRTLKYHVCFLRCLCGTLKIRKILLHYRVIPTNQHNGFLKVLVHIFAFELYLDLWFRYQLMTVTTS